MWISAFTRSNAIIVQQSAVENVFEQVANDAVEKNSKDETITYPIQK